MVRSWQFMWTLHSTGFCRLHFCFAMLCHFLPLNQPRLHLAMHRFPNRWHKHEIHHELKAGVWKLELGDSSQMDVFIQISRVKSTFDGWCIISVLETLVLLHMFISRVVVVVVVVVELSVFIYVYIYTYFWVFLFTKVWLPTCMTINDHLMSNMRNGQHRTKIWEVLMLRIIWYNRYNSITPD